jgi:hypothetical protein
MKPTIGRIVHYVQKKPAWCGPGAGVLHLPAIIVAVWGWSCINLQVFTDGTNSDEQNMRPVKWVTSVSLDASENPQAHTWHWPEVAPATETPTAAQEPIVKSLEDLGDKVEIHDGRIDVITKDVDELSQGSQTQQP